MSKMTLTVRDGFGVETRTAPPGTTTVYLTGIPKYKPDLPEINALVSTGTEMVWKT